MCCALLVWIAAPGRRCPPPVLCGCPRLFELMLVDTKRADLRIESRCRQAELRGSAAEDPPHTVLNEPRMRSIVHGPARLMWAVRGSNSLPTAEWRHIVSNGAGNTQLHLCTRAEHTRDLQTSADDFGPLAHSGQPEVSGGLLPKRLLVNSLSVIADAQAELLLVVLDLNYYPLRLRVAKGV